MDDWMLVVNKNREKHKSLDSVLKKTIQILHNLGIENYITKGDFPATILPWNNKIYFKKYIIDCDMPEIHIEIKKISAGNIDQLEFLNRIRSYYARYIL